MNIHKFLELLFIFCLVSSAFLTHTSLSTGLFSLAWFKIYKNRILLYVAFEICV